MLISVSTWSLEARFGAKKMFEMLRDAGIRAADYNIDDWIGNRAQMDARPNSQRSEEEVIAYYSEIRRYADEAGVVIGQTHAAFGPVGVYTGELRAEMIKATVNAIIATHVLGAPYVVIHPLNILGRLYDEQLEECRELNKSFFAELVPYLKKYNVKVGMENMWGMDKEGIIRPCVCSRPEEILEYINMIDPSCFCACPDLGHFVLTGGDTDDTPATALRKLGNQVKLIHAHEVDGKRDNHTAPFDFDKPMNWREIAEALRDINYQGTLNFEVGGYYYNRFPDELIPAALDHIAAVGNYMIDIIEK